ncbi:hypothetical protein [Planococcus alpniumensis]|uniref:hypothetical protein n=1 Tax=Planococcus alpniumensis TaxID=2708345 RepID=UPI001B8B8B65|nr:hypothetical protein [Planococcus sp. MSAK28401]
MKYSFKLLIVISLAVTGLFFATPALANYTTTGSYNSEAFVTQATPVNRIYVEDIWKGGNVLDKYFVYSNQNGYQYRGYLVRSKIYYGGATYSGWLYRAPLPYPEY